ncbi:MAG: MFS transporter [Coriobacteriia bacterium]|nr:MFS transporter [Coriobacteriia bacterium]MCL2750234.1 MFS transporter [Coriobacteriia bacterium]
MNRARNVAIGSIVMTAVSIGSYMSLPVFLMPISEMTGASIGQVTLLFSFAAIASLLTSLLFGQILKVVRLKLLASLAGLAFALFFVGISLSTSIVVIYAAAVFFGFATVAGGYAASQTSIVWWYPKGTARIISFITVGVGIVAFILSPALASAIETFGVGPTALVEGLVGGAVMIFCALFLLAEHPNTYGVSVEQDAPDSLENDPEAAPEIVGLAMKDILKTPQFWLIFVACVIAVIAMTGFTNNASIFYQSIGLTPLQAAMGISVFSIATLVWAPLYGILVDKKGPAFGTLICGAISAAIMFAATVLTGMPGAMIIAAVAAAMCLCNMLGPVTLPRVFGTREAGSLVGLATAAGSIGAMLGAPIAGFILDSTGSYNPFLITAGILMILCVLFVFLGARKTITAQQ